MLFFDKDFFSSLSSGWNFVDNDFLNHLSKNEKLLPKLLKESPDIAFVVDPLIRFEFLRDVYISKQRILKEKFLEKEVFITDISHQETFKKQNNNALILSKMYTSVDTPIKAGTVDLFLAAKAFAYHKNSRVITCNKRHFPGILFDTVSTMTINATKGNVDVYILSPNIEKYRLLQVNLIDKRSHSKS